LQIPQQKSRNQISRNIDHPRIEDETYSTTIYIYINESMIFKKTIRKIIWKLPSELNELQLLQIFNDGLSNLHNQILQ